MRSAQIMEFGLITDCWFCMLIDSIYCRIRFRLEIFNGIIPTYTHFLQYMLWIYAELWIKRQQKWLQWNSTRKTTTFSYLQAAAAHLQTHRHRRPSFHRNPIAHTNCQLLELVTDQKMIHRIVVAAGLRRHSALLLLLSLAVRLMSVRWDSDRLCCRNFESFCVRDGKTKVIRYDPTQIKCSLQFLSKLIRHFEIEILRLLRLTLRWINVPVVLIAIIRHFQRIFALELF